MSGGTLVIIEGVSDILQTIYHEGRELKVVTLEEESGKVRLNLRGSGTEVGKAEILLLVCSRVGE